MSGSSRILFPRASLVILRTSETNLSHTSPAHAIIELLPRWRVGRVAEGGGLLNRCRTKSSTGGSNPPLSAIPFRLSFSRGRRSQKARQSGLFDVPVANGERFI